MKKTLKTMRGTLEMMGETAEMISRTLKMVGGFYLAGEPNISMPKISLQIRIDALF